VAYGEQAQGTTPDGHIQELITMGGPAPSLAKSHSWFLHFGDPDPMVYGEQARGMAPDGYI
jgi:hypothetical protein